MRATLVGTLIAVALGLVGVSAASATPMGGIAIGKAATQVQPVEQAQWWGYRRRRRNCFHRWRSRTWCGW